MNQMAKTTAAKILNSYQQDQLARILYIYGEVENSRKVAAFQRFAGRLVVAVNTTVDLTAQVREVKAQSRAKAVAVQSYIKTLTVATKAASKVSEVKSKTVGWSVDLLKAMSRDAQAKVALEAAKAAL